jgi:hypothetical protein
VKKNRLKFKKKTNRKNRANRFKSVFVLKTQTEPKPVSLNQFWLFLKKIDLITFFFNKNQSEPNIITPNF